MSSLSVLPAEVRQLIVDQIDSQARTTLGWSVMISLVVALFSALAR